nr:MAG TPA: hypothetical protein [Bacteriophage sp.]
MQYLLHLLLIIIQKICFQTSLKCFDIITQTITFIHIFSQIYLLRCRLTMKTNTHTYIGIRITIVTILFLSIFPIRIFIYPSMFIHFLFCIFSCIGGTAITIVAFRNNSIIPASGITVLSISWLTFISIYSLIVSGDLYKTGYLSCSYGIPTK